MESTPNGIIKTFTKDNRPYYDANDVQRLLGIKRDKAYRVIRRLRKELIEAGKLVDEYPAGRVPKRYFEERIYM